MKRLIAAFFFSLALVFSTPAVPAQAADAIVSCKAVKFPVYNNLSKTLYSDGKRLDAFATKSYKEDVFLAPDVIWTFYSFTGFGLQSRYGNNITNWGGSVGNRLVNRPYTVTATYKRKDTIGNTKPNRTIACTL